LYPYGFRIVEFSTSSSYDFLKTPYPTSVSPGQNFSVGLERVRRWWLYTMSLLHYNWIIKGFSSGLPTNSHKMLSPKETPQKFLFWRRHFK